MNRSIITLLATAMLAACSSVDVTKTGKGHYDPTPPSEVEILKTQPLNREYFELGVVTADGFGSSDVAKMHNAIRDKAADLGAQAVIITSEGLMPGGFSTSRWCTGVAIRWGKAEF